MKYLRNHWKREKERKPGFCPGAAPEGAKLSDRGLAGEVSPVRVLAGAALPACALAAVMSLACARPAYADSKISSVKVKFTLQGTDSDGTPQIEAECGSDRYVLDGMYTLEEYEDEVNAWDDDDDDDNKYVNIDDLLSLNDTWRTLGDYSNVYYAVRLEASDDYYFTKDLERVKPSGLGAECVRLNRLDDRKTLVLFVRFTELNAQAGALENMGWYESGWLAWDEAGSAAAREIAETSSGGPGVNGSSAASSSGSGSSSSASSAGNRGVVYELRLYRGDKLLAEKQTAGNRYDFRPLLREAASYCCQIRGVLPSGTKGDWEDAGSITVSEEMAAADCALFPIETELVGDTTRPGAELRYLNTGWQQDADGRYWYRETDGSYPQCAWREVSGFWYYFDRDGYLVTDSVVSWQGKYFYVNAEGHMLTEGKAPDGRIVQPDGELIWPAS